MKSTETQNGIWNQWQADTYHQSSPKLAMFIQSTLHQSERVIDFGCGNAYYIGHLSNFGWECTGVEGHQLINFLHNNVLIKDLTKPIDLGFKGAVISLEVGEHIAKEFEQVFLDTITNHCDSTLFLSWALPAQPGIGHVNCQPQEYIISEIERRGFKLHKGLTSIGRDMIDDNCDWFRRTLLIFDKV